MGEAFFWGFLAASSLLLGGIIALRWQIQRHLLGLIMAFGAGVLISAVAYELIQEGFETTAGEGGLGLGLAAGAATFFIGDLLIDRIGGEGRKSSAGSKAAGGAALAIVLGIVLDGIPESMVLGLDLLGGTGVSVAFLAAVFMSNLPEAIAATTGLKGDGWSGRRILLLWAGVMLVSGLAALIGYVALEDASPRTLAFVLAFAGGAILTMLADTMMPEAFEHGGKQVGLLTSLGFALAFILTTLE